MNLAGDLEQDKEERQGLFWKKLRTTGLYLKRWRGFSAKDHGEGVSADLGRWIEIGWLGLDQRGRERLSAGYSDRRGGRPWPAAKSLLASAKRALESTIQCGESIG